MLGMILSACILLVIYFRLAMGTMFGSEAWHTFDRSNVDHYGLQNTSGVLAGGLGRQVGYLVNSFFVQRVMLSIILQCNVSY